MNSFKLPDLGEGLQDAEIVEWQVKPGEKVSVDQIIVIVETAKAIVELPSPIDGVISKLSANEGDTIHVGQTLVEYESQSSSEVNLDDQKVESVSVVGELEDASAAGREANIESFAIGGMEEEDVINTREKAYTRGEEINASPDIVAFAKQLGVEGEISKLAPEKITKQDLAHAYEKRNLEAANSEINTNNPVLPLSGTKKIMAQTMMKSHQHVPAVTLFDDAHIGHWKGEDVTVRVIQAMVAACKEVSLLNAWFDEEALSIQTFDDINIGVAVNSEEGLFVPVLREAQDLEGKTIRKLIEKMVRDVKKRSIKPQKLLGATISLSNFGTLSGRYATPIIVPPQVAIVGVGSIRKEPVVKGDQIVVETVMPLSLSFDHRAATGAEAAAFLNRVIQSLEA